VLTFRAFYFVRVPREEEQMMREPVAVAGRPAIES
jgi:hypothetical protein